MFTLAIPALVAPLISAVGMGTDQDWHCPLLSWFEVGKHDQAGAERHMDGIILEVRIQKFMDDPSSVCLLVDAQGQHTVVIVAPLRFVASRRVLLTRGLKLAAEGVLSRVRGIPVFVPRDLRLGSKVLSLRNQWGKPLWTELSTRPPPAPAGARPQ